jgi:hypothetical protein
MNILLYSPDNGVTRNFMPHLWMFLLKSLTPPEHEVFLIDGNAQPMTEIEIAQFVRVHNIRLVGISAMTRMAARAYKMADAIRATARTPDRVPSNRTMTAPLFSAGRNRQSGEQDSCSSSTAACAAQPDHLLQFSPAHRRGHGRLSSIPFGRLEGVKDSQPCANSSPQAELIEERCRRTENLNLK